MVESRPGAGADAKRRPVSRPRSSNRTCPFRVSGFPTGFTVDSRARPQLHITKPEYPQLAEDRFRWKAAGAARGHLVAPPQEMPYALVDVVVDRPVGRRPGSVAVVCRPASEHPIELIPHLRPRPDMARHQQVSHLFLDARYALLRRTRSQIPMAGLPIAMWAKRVTQKVEALFARLPNTGLRLIQSEFQPRHHLPRPSQCLFRFRARGFSPSPKSRLKAAAGRIARPTTCSVSPHRPPGFHSERKS